MTKSLNAGECVEYLGLCVWRSRRWFEGDGKMELMDDRGRFGQRHHHHNKLYKKEGSSRLTPELTKITALITIKGNKDKLNPTAPRHRHHQAYHHRHPDHHQRYGGLDR